MRKYIVGLFLILLLVGCQQQAPPVQEPVETLEEETPTEPVEETAVVEEGTAEEAADMETEVGVGDVSILGKEGFDPEEITVKKGDAVVFTNNDPNGKDAVLTFQLGRKFINSNQIKAGEQYEQIFEEAGTYDYWTVNYGIKGKIIVE
jgi:plastocyanin